MKFRLNLLFVIAALVLGCAALAACGSSSSSSEEASSAASSQETPGSSAVASVPSNPLSGETNGDDADSLTEAVDIMLEANPISNPFEITAMNIEYDFGLAAEDVVSYKGIKSNDNGDAGLVLVIRTEVGKAESIVETLETYKSDQAAFYGNYAEFAQAKANVENAVIGSAENDTDSIVLMMIASNESEGGDALSQAAENVIDTLMG